VTQVLAENELQYILARIRQKTYAFTFRLNYNITPDISIQYYGSPFVSSGIYDDFKRAADAGDTDLADRTHTFTESEISYDASSKTYTVNEGTRTYSFNNPDFSFREFRSNLVARWEYRPGSTLYLVWENNRRSRDSDYYSSLRYNMDELFSTAPTNVFMIKVSFWLGM
jgi:hypothetical protein